MGTLAITKPGAVDSLSSRGTFNPPNPGPYTEGWVGGNATNDIFASTDEALTNGITFIDGVNSRNDLFIAAGESGNNITRQITFGFDENTEVFSLDGQSAINYNSLPAGFQITALTLSLNVVAQAITGNATVTVKVNGVNVVTSPATLANGANNTFTYALPSNLIQSITTFIGVQILIQFNATMSSNGNSMGIWKWSLIGTYQILQYKFTLTPAQAKTHVGDLIAITSPVGGLDLTHISSVNVNYFDSGGVFQTVNIASFVAQSQFLLTFLMIDFNGAFIVSIVANSDGTQFTGSILLGQLLTLNFTTGSGIYKLVDGKSADTLYLNGTNQTGDVAIPSPFIKTGFVGG